MNLAGDSQQGAAAVVIGALRPEFELKACPDLDHVCALITVAGR